MEQLAAMSPRRLSVTNRLHQETFAYDFMGNITSSHDDQDASYDRSLASSNIAYSATAPNRLLHTDGGIRLAYDESGNTVQLKIARPGSCPDGTSDHCSQVFAYDWDEVGQLVGARRWDATGDTLVPAIPAVDDGMPEPAPESAPTWEVSYAYSGGGRTLQSSKDDTGATENTLSVFDTLKIENASFAPTASAPDGDYDVSLATENVYLADGSAHIFQDVDGVYPNPIQLQDIDQTIKLITIGDRRGSASVVIDARTSEVAEVVRYTAYGQTENDFRPERWNGYRARFRFTGKEEDREVGLTYSGARYYIAALGRWASPDPLTIHGLGADLNPYAYVHGNPVNRVDPFGLDDEGPGDAGASNPSVDPIAGVNDDSQLPQMTSEVEVNLSGYGSSAEVSLAEAFGLGNWDAPVAIPYTSSYFTPSGVAKSFGNLGIDIALQVVDPMKYHLLLKATGIADYEKLHFKVGSNDPKDRTRLVGGLTVLAAAAVAGKVAPGIAEEVANETVAEAAGAVAAEGGAGGTVELFHGTTQAGAGLAPIFWTPDVARAGLRIGGPDEKATKKLHA